MRSVVTTLTIIGALLAAAAGSSREQVMTAGDLQELCAGTDHVSRNVCRTYILGVTQGIAVGMNIADGKTRGGRPCVPENVSGERLEQTLTARLDKDLGPANRKRDAADFIGAVLVRSYPCPHAPPSPG